jgi:cytidyltransferase-like protein
MENSIVNIGKRLDNLNNVIKNNHPQDTWILEKILPLFIILINSSTTPEQEQRIIGIINPLFNTYEYRFGLTLENLGQQIANQLLEESTPIIALYPGKFKPPHAGHFDVVIKAAEIADKVIVIMSNVPKDEFTAEDSMKVWGLYEDLLPGNVQVIISDKSSPVSEVFDIIKDKTQDFIVLYGKGEESRYRAIEKDPNTYSNVEVVDAGTFENLNATDLRNSIRNKDLEDIQTFLPKGIDAKKVLDVYTQDEFKPGPVLHELKSELIQNFIKEDIETWGMLPEYKIDLNNTYDYKDENGFFIFYDDINKVNIIVKLKKLPSDIVEFKFYPMKDNELLGFSKLKNFNPKIMNTVFIIFKDEILPNYSNILIQPAGYTRYRLFRAMINNYLDKNQYNIKLKDDIDSPLIMVSKKQSLDELFEKDLPNIEKLNSYEYKVGNGNDIEAIYYFKLEDFNSNWSVHWKFTENNKNTSSEAWRQVTATSYRIIKNFIDDRHPKSLLISGNTDTKTNIYKFDKYLQNLKSLLNNEYRVNNSEEGAVYLIRIDESAKFSIKKRMETMNESYNQALNYFKNGDIFSKSKIERNDTLKRYNSRKQLSEVYNIPFKSNLLLEAFTPQKAPLMKKFVEYACNELDIDEPKIHVINSPTYSQEYKSFGGYIPSEEKIIVVVHNRNMADILRTLAHELVHHMQNLNGNELNGEDGSETENEANARAGVIMRKFGRENPEIFE